MAAVVLLVVVAIGAEALPDAPEAPEHPPYAVCPPPLPRRSSSPELVAAATRGETLEHRTVLFFFFFEKEHGTVLCGCIRAARECNRYSAVYMGPAKFGFLRERVLGAIFFLRVFCFGFPRYLLWFSVFVFC